MAEEVIDKSIGSNYTSNKNTSFACEATAKFLFLGDTKVGKSTMIKRITNDSFKSNTIQSSNLENIELSALPFSICNKYVSMQEFQGDNRILKLSLIDINGKEQSKKNPIFLSLVENDMSAVIFVYDVSNRDTFTKLDKILSNIEDFLVKNQSTRKIQIGNKLDLIQNKQEREVTVEEGKAYANKNGFGYFETSTKDRKSGEFEKTFKQIIDQVVPYVAVNQSNISNNRYGYVRQGYNMCVPNGQCNACSIF